MLGTLDLMGLLLWFVDVVLQVVCFSVFAQFESFIWHVSFAGIEVLFLQ